MTSSSANLEIIKDEFIRVDYNFINMVSSEIANVHIIKGKFLFNQKISNENRNDSPERIAYKYNSRIIFKNVEDFNQKVISKDCLVLSEIELFI